MTTLSLVLPQIGQPDTTEDVKLINGFTAIQSVINGNLDSTNLSAATSQAAGVNASGQTVKGATIIATSEARTNVAYGTLTTPDQVSGIVLASSGLIQVWYQAKWQESVANSATAAIFVGATQLKVAPPSGGNPGVQETLVAGGGGTPNSATPLSSASYGLCSTTSTNAVGYAGDVTTGQVFGANGNGVSASGNVPGGPVSIFAAAGTYTISVQFKASSGTVTVSNRRLYVQAISFA